MTTSPVAKSQEKKTWRARLRRWFRGQPARPEAQHAHVKMYTRRWCGYCVAAERLLARKGVAYQHVDATGDDVLRQWLFEQTGRTTVPQIFIAGASIGGYEELRRLERTGALDRLLGCA